MNILKSNLFNISELKANFHNINVINRGAQTDEQLVEMISQLGRLTAHPVHGMVSKIKLTADAVSIASSTKEHKPHVDATYRDDAIPELIVLHAREVDTSGTGTSYFLSQDEILDGLADDIINILLKSTFKFSRPSRNKVDRHFAVAPIIYKRADGEYYLRWRSDDEVQPELVDSPDRTLALKGLEMLRHRIANAKRYFYQAEQGDTIVIHQHYALHARTEIRPDSMREMVRLWVEVLYVN